MSSNSDNGHDAPPSEAGLAPLRHRVTLEVLDAVLLNDASLIGPSQCFESVVVVAKVLTAITRDKELAHSFRETIFQVREFDNVALHFAVAIAVSASRIQMDPASLAGDFDAARAALEALAVAATHRAPELLVRDISGSHEEGRFAQDADFWRSVIDLMMYRETHLIAWCAHSRGETDHWSLAQWEIR